MHFRTTVIASLASGWLFAGASAQAATIQVDLSSQTMHVMSASGDYDWPISSARSGYVTPRGEYGVQRLEAMHFSHKYHNSPMPHSIFFRGGYAIHGTYATRSLGAPASHGCIRISPGNAALLYSIVKAEGGHISITGTAAVSTRYARAERHRTHYAARHAVHYAARHTHHVTALGYAAAPRAERSFEDWMRAPAGRDTPF